MLTKLLQGLHEFCPRQSAQDIYKAIFQLCMGPEHVVSCRERALAALWEEFRLADSSFFPAEPLLLPLGRDVYRVNLRAAKRQGVPPEQIGQAFLASANTPGDRGRLRELVAELGQTDLLQFGISRTASAEFLADLAPELPPVHHSELYRQLYRPAYRLVRRELLPVEWAE